MSADARSGPSQGHPASVGPLQSSPADPSPDSGADLRRVNPASLARPSGFSHAVVAPPGSRLVFLAGQTGMDSHGRIVEGDVVVQFEQALANLLTALRAAGGAPEHLATVTIYAVDLADYRARARDIGTVWKRLVGTDYPAMAGIGIARLWDDPALVEIQGMAAVPG